MTDRERWLSTSDPAWMLNALGEQADEWRCEMIVRAMRERFINRHGIDNYSWSDATNWKIAIPQAWNEPPVCDLIRCLWPIPFIERSACENKFIPIYEDLTEFSHPESCECKGTGYAPLINHRWRTPLVVNLARQVRGGWFCSICGATKPKISKTPCDCGSIVWSMIDPNPEAITPLIDALQDPPAYCDLPEIIEHMKADCKHLAECCVIGGLLGTSGDG